MSSLEKITLKNKINEKINYNFTNHLLAIILSVSSCKDEKETLPLANYFPLKIGNSWVYDMYIINPDNEYYSKTITKTITGTKTIDDLYFFEITTTSSTGVPAPSIEYIRNDSGYYLDENGDYWIYLEGALNEVVSTNIDSFPSWEIFYESSIVSENESINVSGGAFDCVKYQTKIYTNNPTVDWEAKFDDFYFTDGVGLVKYHNNSLYGDYLTDYRLIFYNIEE